MTDTTDPTVIKIDGRELAEAVRETREGHPHLRGDNE